MHNKFKGRVFIVGGNAFEYDKMWRDRGYTMSLRVEDADIVQFTGGIDVNPELYGEGCHPTVSFNKARDTYEASVFQKAQQLGLACVGICRGSQFLNVMNGGTLVQHCTGHATMQGHKAVDTASGEEFSVTSTHHQMMRPAAHGELLAYANNLCGRKEHCDADGNVIMITDEEQDAEAVYYRDTNTLCFQPHPEFGSAPKECTDKYFEYVERHVWQPCMQ